MHLLVVRFSSLGDVVLASSLPKFIKNRWGSKVKISFLTSQGLAPILTDVPWIDQLHTIPRKKGWAGIKEVLKVVKKIRRNHEIDLILDMHGTLRSLLIRFFNWDIPRLFIDKRSFERWLLTGFKIDFLSWQRPKPMRLKGFGEPVLARNIRDFQGLFDLSPPLYNEKLSDISTVYTKEKINWNQWGIEGENSKNEIICFAPSASFEEKRWPKEKFLQLFETICEDSFFKLFKFVVLAGPDDKFCRIFDPLEKKFAGKFFNLQGKTSLIESALILKECCFCVGNDTGLPHIAESLGIPVITILGPTGEEFGYYPHLEQSLILKKDIWCRPCTTNGKGHCIRSERFCLTTIEPQDVVNKMKTLIEGQRSQNNLRSNVELHSC